MVFFGFSALLPVFLAVQHGGASSLDDMQGYFDTTGGNKFGLRILPEYETERHIFTTNSVNSLEGTEDTVLFRMPKGPKSSSAGGKKPVLIQHAMQCDVDPCTLNQVHIAIAYMLVDQGYDVWLGIGNSSTTAENTISTEVDEKKALEHVAQYIIRTTQQPDIFIMGYFNGSFQFFGMSASDLHEEEQYVESSWIDKIPGVKTVKGWYNKGNKFLQNGYIKIVESIDYYRGKIEIIAENSSVFQLKETVLHAWGVMVNMGPTLTTEDFSRMIDHPDVYLDTPGLITKYGYHSESHHVKTADGYILTLHRITGGQKYPAGPGKPAVLLQHGIMSSSADWVITGPSNALGYLLADEGYDVWLGNSRGNVYSRSHVNLTLADREFWDFSWHEMGVYDTPAVIDYILKTTKQQNISYVGHSQGTTQFFVMLSEKPQYNGKINKMVGYAPVAYTEHIRSPIIKLFAEFSTPLSYALRFLRVHDLFPTDSLLTRIGKSACEIHAVYQVVCSNVLFLVNGYDSDQINKTIVPIIMGHGPAGSSTKQFTHYGQEYNSRKFRQFDYSSDYNVKKYGQREPPEYKLENVKIPTALFYGQNDLLSDYRDVERLARELPNVVLLNKVSVKKFNHIDFLYAISAPELVYQSTIKFLRTSA